MQKIAIFKNEDFEKANKFIEDTGANAKGGVMFQNGEIIVMYNDGKITPGYSINLLNGELADQLSQKVVAVEQLAFYENEMALCESLKPEPLPELDYNKLKPEEAAKERKIRSEWKEHNDKYENIKANLDQSLVLAKANMAEITKKIASLEKAISEIK